MQQAPGEGIRGAKLTQDRPQHGLYLVNGPAGAGLLGRSFGFGPPRNINKVAVDVDAIKATYGPHHIEDYLKLITYHELGHAVGIRHHGDRNIRGPVVLLNSPGCMVGMAEGTVAGAPACSLTSIALRGQQNSGNATCPMKYIQWSWYVPEGWSLADRGPVEFRPDTSWSWSQPRLRLAYEGHHAPTAGAPTRGWPVRRYRNDLDTPPQSPQLCASASGTGVNALPMGENHAGRSTRSPSCSEQLRVNDVPRDTPGR
jgi:hypothetical protein